MSAKAYSCTLKNVCDKSVEIEYGMKWYDMIWYDMIWYFLNKNMSKVDVHNCQLHYMVLGTKKIMVLINDQLSIVTMALKVFSIIFLWYVEVQ